LQEMLLAIWLLL